MADVRIEVLGGDDYRVEITEGGTATTHRVTVTAEDLATYGGGTDAIRLLEESFFFLLEREPKESILGRFELPVIARYFPEYPEEIRKRLARG